MGENNKKYGMKDLDPDKMLVQLNSPVVNDFVIRFEIVLSAKGFKNLMLNSKSK